MTPRLDRLRLRTRHLPRPSARARPWRLSPCEARPRGLRHGRWKYGGARVLASGPHAGQGRMEGDRYRSRQVQGRHGGAEGCHRRAGVLGRRGRPVGTHGQGRTYLATQLAGPAAGSRSGRRHSDLPGCPAWRRSEAGGSGGRLHAASRGEVRRGGGQRTTGGTAAAPGCRRHERQGDVLGRS